MTNMIIDLANYRQQVSDRVPAGEYHGIVEDVQGTKSKAGDNMIVLWVRIVDGDHAGSTLVERLVLTERAMFRTVTFMRALGLPTPKKRLQVNIDRWKGRHVGMQVKDSEPYRGNINSEVDAWERWVGAGGATEGSDDLADLETDEEPQEAVQEVEEPTVEDADVDAADEVTEVPDEDVGVPDAQEPVTAPSTEASSDDDALDLDEIEL